MIKLVASDLDGTILLNGAQSVEQSMIDTISLLLNKGIMFAPASGRQCESLKRLFAPVADDLLYISENGALVKYKKDIIFKQPLDRQLALDIIKDVVGVPNCEVLVSGEKTAYIKPKTEEYYYKMTKVVNYHTTLVENFDDIDEDIVKVAVCDMSGIANSKDYFIEKWSKSAAVTVSGDLYMDFMDLSVNKGNAIKHIQQYFDITPNECMAFGDNYNDIELLDSVVNSYAMKNAADDIKLHSRYITENVEKTLRREFGL